MKIIITESQLTIIDWYNHNENLFESIFNHLINGSYIKNFVWSDDIDFVCNKIINRLVEIYYKKKSIDLDEEHFDFIKNVFEDRIIKKVLSLKNRINESTDYTNIVEELMELENIEINFEYIDGRVLDDDEIEEYFGTTVIDDDEIEDSLGGGAKIYIHEVYVNFYINNNLTTLKSIYFITKNNKVIGVNSHSRFTDVATSFKYIPNDILMPYFIERAKSYLEKILPNKNKLNESVDNSDVVKQILDSEGIKFRGFVYGGRSYDNFKRQRDSVSLFFTDPIEPDYTYEKTIIFLTKDNKVVDVYSSSDFRPLSDSFRYIPTEVLMDYFFEKAKTYLEMVLS